MDEKSVRTLEKRIAKATLAVISDMGLKRLVRCGELRSRQ
jgi:hypothetical protein